MPTTVYETMFILDSNRYARDAHGVSGQIGELIEKLEGEVLVSRLWNEQKLAYPINGQHKGTYWLAYFRLDNAQLTPFNRACQLNENILRHLTLKVDPRLVETLVAHAQGRQIAKADEVAIAVDEDEDEDSDVDVEAVAAND